MMAQNIEVRESTSIVGVVADVKRNAECDHEATKCCVFGINEAEFNALAAVSEIRPRFFTNEAHRYVAHIR